MRDCKAVGDSNATKSIFSSPVSFFYVQNFITILKTILKKMKPHDPTNLGY